MTRWPFATRPILCALGDTGRRIQAGADIVDEWDRTKTPRVAHDLPAALPRSSVSARPSVAPRVPGHLPCAPCLLTLSGLDSRERRVRSGSTMRAAKYSAS